MKSEVTKQRWIHKRIAGSHFGCCIKKRKDQLRRTTRDLSTRVAKCAEVDRGILEHLL